MEKRKFAYVSYSFANRHAHSNTVRDSQEPDITALSRMGRTDLQLCWNTNDLFTQECVLQNTDTSHMNVLSCCEAIICLSAPHKKVDNHLSFLVSSLSAGGQCNPVGVCELHWDFPPVDDWAWPPQVQSEKRGVQRHTLPEGNKKISAGEKKMPKFWMRGINRHCCHNPYILVLVVIRTRDQRCEILSE